MKRSEVKIVFYCLIMCVMTGFFSYQVSVRQQKKIGLIDAVRLFDGYNMKTELEALAKVKLQTESKQLDSMSNILQMAKSLNGNGEELKRASYGYSNMKAKLDEDYAQSNRDINSQVWKRLNPLLEEYGKKNGLHLIIGANGMGSVLYADEYYDLTNDVIQYINKRYAEGN